MHQATTDSLVFAVLPTVAGQTILKRNCVVWLCCFRRGGSAKTKLEFGHMAVWTTWLWNLFFGLVFTVFRVCSGTTREAGGRAVYEDGQRQVQPRIGKSFKRYVFAQVGSTGELLKI